MQKKGGYNDFIKKYIQKTDGQRRKLLILCEEAIEKYKAFKNSYTNEKMALLLLTHHWKKSYKTLAFPKKNK